MPNQLLVRLVRASNLRDASNFGVQDPYVLVQYGNEIKRTKVCRGGGVNPSWNETLIFDVHDMNLDVIRLTVETKKLLAFTELIGAMDVSLRGVFAKGSLHDRIPLSMKEHGQRGDIEVIMKFGDIFGSYQLSTDRVDDALPQFPMNPPSPGQPAPVVNLPHKLDSTREGKESRQPAPVPKPEYNAQFPQVTNIHALPFRGGDVDPSHGGRQPPPPPTLPCPPQSPSYPVVPAPPPAYPISSRSSIASQSSGCKVGGSQESAVSKSADQQLTQSNLEQRFSALKSMSLGKGSKSNASGEIQPGHSRNEDGPSAQAEVGGEQENKKESEVDTCSEAYPKIGYADSDAGTYQL